MLSRSELSWNLKLTQFCSISAVDVERLIAFVVLSDGWVEDEAVGTESLLRDAVATLVVLVTLDVILVLSEFVVGAFVVLAAFEQAERQRNRLE